MNHFFTTVLIVFVLYGGNVLQAQSEIEVVSPDQKVQVKFRIVDGVPNYDVAYAGKGIIEGSELGFTLSSGKRLSDGFVIADVKSSANDSTWEPLYGERSEIRDHFNEVVVTLEKANSSIKQWEVALRCYDAGLAFRSKLTTANPDAIIKVKSEDTQFRFKDQRWAWCTQRAQAKYTRKPISAMGNDVERPLTIEGDDDIYVSITEANLRGYARMKLKRDDDDPNCVVSEISGNEVKAKSTLQTAWRVIMLASSPGQLLENSSLVLNLNDPNEIADTSWIKPGKVLREMTLTNIGGKAAIDFAARHHFSFVEFDAGWYGNEFNKKSDATTVTLDPKRSAGPFDLLELIEYGKQKNIGIILYVNRRSLERQLDDVLPLLQQWGVKGVKYGFVNVGSQRWTKWLHDAIAQAAKHQLMVDVHDEYRSMGFARTYPNLMTQEGVGGDETSPSNHQTLVNVFTRYLAGSADFTPCYYDQRVKKNASHAHQLAKPICCYSPWQFLFWYDSPVKDDGVRKRFQLIHETPELELWDAMPTVWDETRVPAGAIGKYAVVARRSGDDWFIGGLTDDNARSIPVELDFLKPNTQYVANIYSDDATVDTPSQISIKRTPVDSSKTLMVEMREKGGQAIWISVKSKDDN